MTTFIHHGHLRQMLERKAKRRAVRSVPTLTPSDLRGMATITLHGPTDPETKARLMRRIQEEMEKPNEL